MKSIKYILLSGVSLSLAACIGGSDSGTSNQSANPLEITQNIIPTLNKIGSHQIWYMVIKNPNDFQLLGASIKFQSFTSNRLDPTKYMLPYDGAINGVTTDCSTLFNPNSDTPGPGPAPAPSPNAPGLQAGQSCAYKFEARWGWNSNIDPQESVFPFKMYYYFYNTNSSTYEEYGFEFSNTCSEGHNHFCLPDNQNLQFKQVLATPLKSSDVNSGSYPGLYDLVTSQNISLDGKYAWSVNINDSSASLYSINYNDNTNSTNLQLESSYSGDWFSNTQSSVLSYDGMNWFRNIYYQQGLIGLDQRYNNVQWVYGLDNNIYGNTGNNYTLPYALVKLNQDPINIKQSTVTNIVSLGKESPFTLLGISETSNILISRISGGSTYFYCYYANDNYINPKSYLGNLSYDGNSPKIIVTPNGYYYKTWNYYKSIDNKSYRVYSYYKIDIDNCLTDNNNYFAFDTSYDFGLGLMLNQKFGTVHLDYSEYMDTYNSFSNGLNGGN